MCWASEMQAQRKAVLSPADLCPQVVLIISGNLSFLNWLTIVPSLACFDDAALGFLFPSGPQGLKDRVLKIQRMEAQGIWPAPRYGRWDAALVTSYPGSHQHTGKLAVHQPHRGLLLLALHYYRTWNSWSLATARFHCQDTSHVRKLPVAGSRGYGGGTLHGQLVLSPGFLEPGVMEQWPGSWNSVAPPW